LDGDDYVEACTLKTKTMQPGATARRLAVVALARGVAQGSTLEDFKLLLSPQQLAAAAGSDAFWNEKEFSIEHDPSGLRFESNVFRYRRFSRAILRAEDSTSDDDLARLLLVAKSMDIAVSLSLESPRKWLTGLGFECLIEPSEALAARLPALAEHFGLVRAPGAGTALKSAAIAAGLRWADGPVLTNARLEWPAWLLEQSISETRHRYGNLLPKPSELDT
jgi:RHH-type proline utilization regulon transcriptional repressor/proline dehydrogenase/delta 1-pyrroline-5-carboxylate dehydrogenase